MKLASLLQASTLAAFAAIATTASAADAAAPAAVAAAPAAAAPAPVAPKYTDEQVFEAFGYLVGQRIGVSQFELTAGEKAALMKGLTTAFDGVEGAFSPEAFGPEIQRVLGGRHEAAQAKAAEKGKAESSGYFADLKAKGVKSKMVEVANPANPAEKIKGELFYEIVTPGGDQKPKPTDTVKVHYTGKLLDGKVFDSSVTRGEPVEFPLNQVIPGWTEGLQLIGKGGKVKLHIPSELGYGAQGSQGAIPPFATLVFDVELIDIKAPAAPTEAVTEPLSIPDEMNTPAK
jgi:FKBP-type peptidyl-prolyl cis-trans isomerase